MPACGSGDAATELARVCKMVEVGGDIWRLPSPIPVLKQGHQEQVAQDHVKNFK